jgi:hypothetical protein
MSSFFYNVSAFKFQCHFFLNEIKKESQKLLAKQISMLTKHLPATPSPIKAGYRRILTKQGQNPPFTGLSST